MKERPILFSAPMVRAILAGEKTQTRRVVKASQPGRPVPTFVAGVVDGTEVRTTCPYGRAGSRLWVRETWQHADWTEDGEPYIRYAADNAVRLIHEWKIPEEGWDHLMDRWAELSVRENTVIDGTAADRKWRPSIFMPRWASRITLEITEVRVQRLDELSREDAFAEGVRVWEAYEAERTDSIEVNYHDPRDSYAFLWESINGVGSWKQNPWVWVLTFRRVEVPV